MLTSSEVSRFWEVYCDIKRNPSQRRGQAMMNALAKVRPDLYDKVTGTEADPFYIDNRIYDFKRAVGI